MTSTDDLVAEYVAVWNEPDPATRRASVAALWRDDAVQVLASREVEGHLAIEERIAAAHRDLVLDKGFTFTLAGGLPDGVQAHHDAITFDVDMAPAVGGAVAWIGRVVLLLDREGRIRRDYQFGRNLAP